MRKTIFEHTLKILDTLEKNEANVHIEYALSSLFVTVESGSDCFTRQIENEPNIQFVQDKGGKFSFSISKKTLEEVSDVSTLEIIPESAEIQPRKWDEKFEREFDPKQASFLLTEKQVNMIKECNGSVLFSLFEDGVLKFGGDECNVIVETKPKWFTL